MASRRREPRWLAQRTLQQLLRGHDLRRRLLQLRAVRQPGAYALPSIRLRSCPTGWTCSDIGGPLPLGQQTLTGSTWSISGGGGDIWGTSDAFHFVNQTLAADGTVAAQVTSQTPTDPWAKAGVMLRATSDPGSPYYAAFVTPGNGVAVQWRTAQGGSSSQVATAGTVPTYLQIGRYTSGSTVYYTAYTSPNGTTWTAVPGSTQTVAGLTGTLLAGLAVTSHDQGTSSTVGFDTVSVTATEFPPPGFGCPTGWTCSDIGGPLPLGQQTLTGSTWSISGGGGDIWGTSDAFHFVNQTLAADGTVAAQVTSQTPTDPWAKAGVMLRATSDPGSPYYAAFVTPGNGVAVQWRTAQGGSSSQVATAGTVPTYLQIGRYTSREHRLLHGIHVAQRNDVDGRARLDSDGGRPDRHPPGRPGRHLPRPGNELDGRLQYRVGDGHRVPAARLSAARPAGPARTSGAPFPSASRR